MICSQSASWVRSTQFAGDHPFCDLHALIEEDFGEEGDSYSFWKEIEMEKKLFEVDVLVSFRNKYFIEAESLEHAYDELVMTEHNRDFDEVTQKFLGEQIIEGREITREGVTNIVNRLKDDKSELCSYWMDEKLIHKIDYNK